MVIVALLNETTRTVVVQGAREAACSPWFKMKYELLFPSLIGTWPQRPTANRLRLRAALRAAPARARAAGLEGDAVAPTEGGELQAARPPVEESEPPAPVESVCSLPEFAPGGRRLNMTIFVFAWQRVASLQRLLTSLQAAECLCLPIQGTIGYSSVADDGEYPPSIVAAGAKAEPLPYAPAAEATAEE